MKRSSATCSQVRQCDESIWRRCPLLGEIQSGQEQLPSVKMETESREGNARLKTPRRKSPTLSIPVESGFRYQGVPFARVPYPAWTREEEGRDGHCRVGSTGQRERRWGQAGSDSKGEAAQLGPNGQAGPNRGWAAAASEGENWPSGRNLREGEVLFFPFNSKAISNSFQKNPF